MKRNHKPNTKQASRNSLIQPKDIPVQPKDILNINHDDVYSFSSIEEVNLQATSTKVRPKMQSSSDCLNKEVPIYRVVSKKDIVTALFSAVDPSPFFAHGQLKGKFYENSKIHQIKNISFVGVFEGMFDWQAERGFVYFEGNIQKIQFLTREYQELQDKDLETVSLYQSSFHGLFKGCFYPWSIVGGVQNIREEALIFADSRKVPRDFNELHDQNCNRLVQSSLQETKRKVEYYLPTLVCFDIKNFGDINLQKSSAVINGYLHLQIHYNTFLQHIFQSYKKQKRKLSLGLNFNRDVTLFLPLQEQQDSDSEDSEWSIQQKTWDIQMTHNKQQQTFSYRILKRFRAEIDNTYGGFFAPFSLNRLKIVITISTLKVEHEGQEIKLHFTCVDTHDNHPLQNFYNPFSLFNDLSTNDQVSSQQVNRYFKINRHYCTDNGEYIIADNKLVLHPHFKNILKNKSFTNYDPKWNLGIRDYLYLLDPPLAHSIPHAFQQFSLLFEDEEQSGKHIGFSMLSWDKVIIQVPIYKYIIIDMIKIFVPLTIITIVSLFIFNQENGIGKDSHFTTLAMRLVNVAAIAIAYTNLIPIILSSLPKMPGITLIQIVTYLETIPSLLAVANSMFYYTIDLQEWRRTFRTFYDFLFLIGFVLTLVNLSLLISVFIGYSNMSYNVRWKINEFDKAVIKWRSPMYLRFMESVMTHKGLYYAITEENA